MRVSSQIQRRLLVNYRADPEVVARLLPMGLQPQLVNGFAVAGICLIRLGEVRPRGVPAPLGLTTENAAHRIAVEWPTPQGPQAGVFVPRRDSASRLTQLLGGRLFPGVHQRARFEVIESEHRVRVAYAAADGGVAVDAEVEVTAELNDSRLFGSLDEASAFFRAAPVAWSPGRDQQLESVRLSTDAWSIEAARPVRVLSSYYEDASLFPAGSIELDSALLMRDVPVSWHGQGATAALRAASAARTA